MAQVIRLTNRSETTVLDNATVRGTRISDEEIRLYVDGPGDKLCFVVKLNANQLRRFLSDIDA